MFSKIILALDGSESSDRAIPVAQELALRDSAPLIVVHVNELLVGRAAGPVHANEDELVAKVRKQVEELQSAGVDATLETATVMLGGPAQVVAKVARDRGADLIVVGTRGHAPIAGLVLGSVTQRLLHIAHCPVLVIPPEYQPAVAGGSAAKEATAH